MTGFNQSIKGIYFSKFNSDMRLTHVERLISISIVVCLITVALFEYRVILSRARCVMAMADITEVRNRLIFHRSISGDWPESEEDLGPIKFRTQARGIYGIKTIEAVYNTIRRGQVSGSDAQAEPDSGEVPSTQAKNPKYIVVDGTITVNVPKILVRDEPIALLSLRHATGKTPGMPTLSLLCGNEEPDNRIDVLGPNHTNINSVNLPRMCR